MKKFFLVLTVVAIALALAAPAMAGLKLTSKGRMDITGQWISNNLVDPSRQRSSGEARWDDPADWYHMELVIDPVLYVNEKVSIHARITMMEHWWGTAGVGVVGNVGDGAAGSAWRNENNLWLERLWVEFPVLKGWARIGRAPWGAWAYDFENADAEADRIMLFQKFGPYLFAGFVDKIAETDGVVGAVGGWLNPVPARAQSPFNWSHRDINAYGVVGVLPFDKGRILWRPLFYYFDFQFNPFIGFPWASVRGHGYQFVTSQALGLKYGIFKLDFEGRYRSIQFTKVAFFNDTWEDWTADNISAWMELGVHPGPFSIVGGGFYLQGASERARINQYGYGWWESQAFGQTLGQDFEPTLLFFSEDMGALWNSGGVPNGAWSAVAFGASGYESVYLRGGYKINDTMSLSAIYLMLWADKMYHEASADGHGSVSRWLGAEANVGFEWKFMDNIKYVVEAAYLWPGAYWDTSSQFNASRDVFGFRHMLVISW